MESNKITFIYHPACSKTPKTRDFLEGQEVVERNLVEEMLSASEVLDIARTLGVKVHDLLRPSSPVYTEREAELYAMTESELADVISTEPTLIKRPIVKSSQGLVIGFDQEKLKELL